MDLAVGVVIGGAFGSIVKSLVDQVVMPPIGWLMGGVDFSDLKLTLPANPMTPDAEPVLVLYGAFINTIIQFLIVAAAVFVLVKVINSLRRQQAAEPAPETAPAPTPSRLALSWALLSHIDIATLNICPRCCWSHIAHTCVA